MASKSLGPFPKTRRWQEIVGEPVSDQTLEAAKRKLDAWSRDEEALNAVIGWIAPVIANRFSEATNPQRDSHHPAVRALNASQAHIEAKASKGSLFPLHSSKGWRQYDGPSFCDLARLYFEHLLAECLLDVCIDHELQPAEAEIRRFAKEASTITRSFSARWFNACARYQTPEEGSIRWYLGHCLGKLDLELCREESSWIEPTGNPWKRKRTPEPSLSL